MLNDQPYCGCTGKLTKIKSYCHALESTKGTKLINPFDKFPNKIKYDGSKLDMLCNEVGYFNLTRLEKCAELRGSHTLLYRIVHEFNWFVRVINLGYLVDNEEYKYLYDKYSRYSDASLDELIEQFENYCKERYDK
jgi:hypothetical protein